MFLLSMRITQKCGGHIPCLQSAVTGDHMSILQ